LLLHLIFSCFWMASCNHDKPRKVAEYWVLLWYQEWRYQESFSISGRIGAAFLSNPDLILDVMLFSFEQLPFSPVEWYLWYLLMSTYTTRVSMHSCVPS
jgi:hypothetical protein